MEPKKISFGFKKTKKVDKPVVEEKRDYIECVEEKSIKVVGGEEVEEKAPLVIVMKPNTLITAERLKQIAEQVESAVQEPDVKEEPDIKQEPQDEIIPEDSLEQMAIRELMQEAKKEVKVETMALTVPVPAKPVMDGQKESTLDDYESVPIQEFGMAMLRGMGWTPNKEQSKYKQPQLRPKGLGLGADKVVTDNQKNKIAKDSKGEELPIVKNSFVKVTTGKFSGYYGKVVSLDEDNGRVMVDIAVKKEMVSLSEFMMHPVTKSEYDKESKVINAGSYEEYKKKEKNLQISTEHDEGSTSQKSYNIDNKEKKYSETRREREHDNSSNGRSRKYRRDTSSSEDRSSRRRKEKRHSSNDSLNSQSDSEKRSKKKKSGRRRSSDSSDSHKESRRHKRDRTPKSKRDIDKKRKGKKKKRDRDRSPNYKKHRK